MRNILFLLSLLIFIACQNESAAEWKHKSLLEYGVPLSIPAPDSVKVEQMDLIVKKDISLRNDEGYFVQIFAGDAVTTNVSTVKATQKSEVESNPYFSKMISENDAGFFYQTAVDSNNINYGFRHVVIQGDKEFIFQTGLIGRFTEEQAMKMYEAAQAVK